MSNLNQVGFHLVDDVYSESQVIQHLALLYATRPACITVLGASQYAQALDFAKRAKAAFPEMRCIFRHFINKSHPDDEDTFEPQAEDTGRHTRMSAEAWWERVGKLYIDTGLTLLPDNESTMMDYTPYSEWMAKVMQLAGAAGVPIAFGRFPAFHPVKGREQQMDAMLKAAFQYPFHTHSPNLYWSADNIDAFQYPYYLINYADKKLGIKLDTTIGEFALLRDVRDAYNGWRSANVSGKVYALDLVIKAKVHLPGIPVCTYSIGKWPINADTFSLDTDALETIKANLTPLTSPPIVIPPPPPDPPKGTPMIEPNARGEYDLVPFLRGNGIPYLTKNNWSGDEVNWTQIVDDRRWLQRKNDHSEEFGLTAKHIVRGLDDSPGGGYAYVLRNVDETPASPWSPRLMKPGDVFYREALVNFYKLTNGEPGPSYIDKTHLKFVKFHPTWKSWAGLTIANVVEMEVYTDNKGVPGVVWERYAYAHGLGLVGWQGGNGLKKMMGIAAHDGNLSKKPRMVLSWYGGLMLPAMADIVIEIDDPRWKNATVKTKGTSTVNLRKQPSTSAEVLGGLQPGVAHEGRAIEAAFTGTDGKAWYAVELLVLNKAIAWVRSDVAEATSVADPPPKPSDEMRLKVLDEEMTLQSAHAQQIHNSVLRVRSLYEIPEGIIAQFTQSVQTIGEIHMSPALIRTLVIGIIELLVLLGSGFIPELAAPFRLLAVPIGLILLYLLGVPVVEEIAMAYVASRVEVAKIQLQTAQIQALAAQRAMQPEYSKAPLDPIVG